MRTPCKSKSPGKIENLLSTQLFHTEVTLLSTRIPSVMNRRVLFAELVHNEIKTFLKFEVNIYYNWWFIAIDMRLQNMAWLHHYVLFLELKEKSIQNSSDHFMQMQSNKKTSSRLKKQSVLFLMFIAFRHFNFFYLGIPIFLPLIV